MKKDDLLNKTFGYLTVLESDGITNAGHSKWKCQCICGKIVSRTSTSMKRSKFSNCGCAYVRNSFIPTMKVGRESPFWKGEGEISASWFHNVIVRAASGRKSRSGIVKKLDVDIKYIWNLFLKQERKCALTGIELTFPFNNTHEEFKKSTASLDRIDSSLGYVKDNVQWVHKHINIMKNVYDEKHFIEMCKLVAANCCEVKSI